MAHRPRSRLDVSPETAEVVDSVKHPLIAQARALASRSGRLEAGRCLLEGAALVGQAHAAGVELSHVLCADDGPAPGDLAGVPVHRVRAGLLRKVLGTARPVECLAVATLPGELSAASEDAYGDFAVVCERIADPGNLGTIARTAAALGVRDLVLADTASDPSARRVLDASRAAVLSMRVHRHPDGPAAIAALQRRGFQVVATSPAGRHVQSLAPLRGGRVALVTGNETDGLPAATLDAADLVVQVPMAGAVESLNVGVAAGLGIYELRTRMILGMLTDRIRGTLGRNLAGASELVRQAFDARLSALGDLDGTAALMLMVLACDRTSTPARLTADLRVPEATARASAATLAERGYVARDGEELTITGDGEHAVAALWTVQERLEEDLVAGFSAAERDQLTDLLTRVQRNAAATLPDGGAETTTTS